MINTILGSIPPDKLGLTLMHEHIMVNMIGAEFAKKTYTTNEVVEYLLPYLINAKKKGLSTICEATPKGFGRDLAVLEQCAKESGLNIIACTGAWDAHKVRGRCVPKEIREKPIDEIASVWINEFENGMDDTSIKPGFIKMALGDEGEIFPLQEKLLRAAARTSLQTGLRIHCHVWHAHLMPRIIEILKEEQLPFNHFNWVHADNSIENPIVYEYAKMGMWVQFDGIGWIESYERYPSAIKKLKETNLIKQLLFGQDSGCFDVKKSKKENKEQEMNPYATFFDKFLPFCLEHDITNEQINQVLIDNARKALTIIEHNE